MIQLKKLVPVETARTTVNSTPQAFAAWRNTALAPFDRAAGLWNEAVANVVATMGLHLDSQARRRKGEAWVNQLIATLRTMRAPLKSDVIVSANTPMAVNALVSAGVRALSATMLEQDLEFMPRSFDYPKFPYFEVEPATLASLAKAGLVLLANGPAPGADEPCSGGVPINRETYLRRPLISIGLELSELPPGQDGAILVNWSCRGRNGAMAKVFIDGELDVPPFEVMTTSDDATPNFWTILPWRVGGATLDLKLVGEASYLWFEHADVHVVRWLA